MKRIQATAVGIVLSLMLSAYGCMPSTTANNTDTDMASFPESSVGDTVSKENSTEDSSLQNVRKQKLTRKINIEEKPEITKAELIAMCPGKIIDFCEIDPYYPGNVMISGTVGLIGSPIKLSCEEAVSDLTLTLTYSEDDLRGIPEKNIAVMYVDEENQNFIHLDEAELDTENNCVSFPVKNNGIYLLFDIYAYGSVMYWDVAEYAYEKDVTDYISDWERECDTGDIMTLTDKTWVKENAPNFHVTDEKQLASVVYYANAVGGEINIYLDNDIDLSNYHWAPMGWTKSSTNITIYGQQHTVNGLTINMPGQFQVGLTGYAQSVKISDLTITNADITGSNYVGIICGECHGDKVFERVSISGNVNGTEGTAGAFVGAGDRGEYIDCTFDVKVNGKPFEYHTPEEKVKADNSDTSRYTLSINEQGRVQRTEADFDKSLSRVIYNGGKHILTRGAENELEIPDWVWEKVGTKDTTYTIYLQGYYSDTNSSYQSGYVILSNTIEYTYQ